MKERYHHHILPQMDCLCKYPPYIVCLASPVQMENNQYLEKDARTGEYVLEIPQNAITQVRYLLQLLEKYDQVHFETVCGDPCGEEEFTPRVAPIVEEHEEIGVRTSDKIVPVCELEFM